MMQIEIACGLTLAITDNKLVKHNTKDHAECSTPTNTFPVLLVLSLSFLAYNTVLDSGVNLGEAIEVSTSQRLIYPLGINK